MVVHSGLYNYAKCMSRDIFGIMNNTEQYRELGSRAQLWPTSIWSARRAGASRLLIENEDV